MLARQKHPGQKNSLDALCRRYQVDNSARTLHGALLDAEILADVYLAMTGGQTQLFGLESDADGQAERASRSGSRSVTRPQLRVHRATEQELTEHEQLLDLLDRRAKGGSVWRRV